MSSSSEKQKVDSATETDEVSLSTVTTVARGGPEDRQQQPRDRGGSLRSLTPSERRRRRRQARPLGGEQEVKFYRSISNPCCCPLQDGVLWISIIEMVIYCIGIGVTGYWYSEVNAYRDKNELNAKQEKEYELIAQMSLVQIGIFTVDVMLSFGLAVASVKRNAKLATAWVIGLLITSALRIIVMIVCPVAEFEFSMISFLIEMYYMWVVSCFATECKLYPNGVEYIDDSYLPWIQPVEPVYSYGGIGYELVELPPTPNPALGRPHTKQPKNNKSGTSSSPPPLRGPQSTDGGGAPAPGNRADDGGARVHYAAKPVTLLAVPSFV